jgi:hypothetical protein
LPPYSGSSQTVRWTLCPWLWSKPNSSSMGPRITLANQLPVPFSDHSLILVTISGLFLVLSLSLPLLSYFSS